jgi:protoporphyrinogen oxidase
MTDPGGVTPAAGERWAVVGGGLLGLTLARRLALAGRAVTLVEAAPAWGGLAAADALGDVTWDRFYHVVLESDLRLLALLAELGLEREVEWGRAESGLFWNGATHPMTRPAEQLRFRGLSPLDKARLALTVLRAARIDDASELEGETAVAWLRRWSGRRAVERFWRPLLRSKLGEQADEVAATFVWASIRRLQGARGGAVRADRFGVVRGGYARILARLEAELRARRVEMLAGAPVTAVALEPRGGLRLESAGAPPRWFDRVVLTLPSPLVARIAGCLSDAERAAHAGVRYQGVVCASLLLRRPLSRYYVLNLADDGLPFTGVVETTALVDPAQFGGRSLVYLPRYLPPDDPWFERGDAALRPILLAGLRRVVPDFSEDDVLAFRVARARHVFAVPRPGHSAAVPPAATGVDGLFVVNSTRILDGTLNVDETVRVAESAAAWLLAGAPGAAPATSPPGARDAAFAWSEGLERDEAGEFWRRARPHLELRPDDVALDFGCGAGHVAEALAGEVAEVHAVDVDPVALARGRRRVGARANLVFHALEPRRPLRLDAVDGRRFTLVLCVSVLQYFRDVEQIEALAAELARRTAPAARVVLADLPARRGALAEGLEFLWRRARRAGPATAFGELVRGAVAHRARSRAGGAWLRTPPEEIASRFARHGFVGAPLPALTVHGGRANLLLRRVANARAAS